MKVCISYFHTPICHLPPFLFPLVTSTLFSVSVSLFLFWYICSFCILYSTQWNKVRQRKTGTVCFHLYLTIILKVISFIKSWNDHVVLFSHSIMSDSLRSYGLQHARLPCPSPSPRACSNSCPLRQWCHPTISSSVIPFSSCLQSFPASGSFPMCQLFASGGQSIGVSVSASVLPMCIQGWFSLGLTGLILLSKRLSRVFSSTSIWKHQFFGAQPSLWSNSYILTWLLVKP